MIVDGIEPVIFERYRPDQLMVSIYCSLFSFFLIYVDPVPQFVIHRTPPIPYYILLLSQLDKHRHHVFRKPVVHARPK